MLTEFRPLTDLHADATRLAWTWTGPEDRPLFRLVRRPLTYPDKVADGVTVLDLGELLQTPALPWAAVERTLFLVPSSHVASPLQQAETLFFFAGAGDLQPAGVVIRIYDTTNDSDQIIRIENVTRVTRTEQASPPWAAVTTLTIFAAQAGGPEMAIGEVTVATRHVDGLTADRFTWTPAAQPPLRIDFDQFDAHMTVVGTVTVTDDIFRAGFQTWRGGTGLRVGTLPADYLAALAAQASTSAGGGLLAQISIDDHFDQDTGDWQRRTTVAELGLMPGTTYYYRLFLPDADAPESYHTDNTLRAVAVSTGIYGLSHRLYQLLPAVHQQYDEPAPGEHGDGQLRRFLQIFGSALDHARGLAENLDMRHDVHTVRADLVPHLSRWLGWEPDQTLDVLAQRRDIRFAPEIYGTTGTGPNLCALVNRMTGWDCRIKEFVNNVFQTNAPESILLWEIWEQRHDGLTWSTPVPNTRNDNLDGRPAAVLAADNTPWLFWHAKRTDRREIWLQRQDGIDAAPQRAAAGAPDDAPAAHFIDESPAAALVAGRIWLFWSSNRDGNWEIYTRPYTTLPGDPAVRLTDHPAEDRAPAAVGGVNDTLWLFWQSNRRGPTDLWGRANNGDTWSPPARLTSAEFRHETPAAAVDASGRLWLFWSADLGDRRNLFVRVRGQSSWLPGESLTAGWDAPQQITEGRQRDEAPTAVLFNGGVWLFWHSDRGGQWQIWNMIHDGAGWSEPSPIVAEVTADKEPTAIVDAAGTLRLLWRSQRRGRHFQSRTVDTGDPEMLAQLHTFDDRAHYTYHTGAGNEDWYARGIAGIYLAPDTNDTTVVADRISRAANFVESFRPAPVRLVWIPESVE